MRKLIFWGFALLTCTASAGDQENIEEAKKIFTSFVELEQSFDSRVADLFSDPALIRHTRVYPMGQTQTIELLGMKYKFAVRKAMPVAEEAGDWSKYTDCTYKPESADIRIDCSRYSMRKHYSSPVSMLVGREGARWVIKEAISQSQP